jgi:hypothetical protein
MAFRIVQTVNAVSVAAGTATTSNAISLQSGYLRVSCASTAAYIQISENPVATANDFMIVPNSSDVLKQRVARQRILGITTGTTTVVEFGENNGNPFIIGDYVTIFGGYPVGVNTSHTQVTATNTSSITLNWNSSSVTGIAVTNATISRSVKVSVFAPAATTVSIAEVQTASVT